MSTNLNLGPQPYSRLQTVLGILLFLFCLRVVGQLIVMIHPVGWLPEAEEWFSGTLSYPLLLTAQIAIIWLYGKVCLDLSTDKGYFAAARHWLGKPLVRVGAVYFGIMVLRYILRMAMYPHERWFGGCIPIFFHCILASFLIVLGAHNMLRLRNTTEETRSGACRSNHFLKRRRLYRQIIHNVSRLAFWTAVATGIGIWLAYQLAPSYYAAQVGYRRPEYAVRKDKAAIATTDGVKLVADIYRPVRRPKSPTILVRIPFSKSFKNEMFANLFGRAWAERGYTVVIQGTRGRYESTGNFYPLIFEREDGKQTLTWISKQPWFNGQILTWGGSSFGHTQWAVCDQNASGLVAMNVYLSSTRFSEMFYPGGAFSLQSALSWAVCSSGKEDLPQWPSEKDIAKYAKGFPMRDADKRATKSAIPFFRDWADHALGDHYWEQVDGKNRIENLKTPVLLLAGWYDPFLPGQLKDFQEIRHSSDLAVRNKSRIIIGPWVHGGDVVFPEGKKDDFRSSTIRDSLRWFDQMTSECSAHADEPFPLASDHSPLYQTEAPAAAQSAPPPRVRIFVAGINKWRDENEWPLARTQYTSYYLHSTGRANGNTTDGEVSLSVAGDETPDTFLYNPNDPVPTAGGPVIGKGSGIAVQNRIESRADVLNYSTPVLPSNLEATGPVKVELFVSSTARNTDFTAKLVDVYADGKSYNVCEGIKRVTLSDSGSGISKIALELWPASRVFKKGHRIRLEVSSSNFPRFDANRNTDPLDAATKVNTARQVIYHDDRHRSRLILPVIPAALPEQQ